MALFGNTSKKTTRQPTPGSERASPKAKLALGREHVVLEAPWLSEKALIGTENGVYVFRVPADATKPEIAAAVEAVYHVLPRQVRIVNLPAKHKALRSRAGYGARARRHKAYVYLKKGDRIEF